MEADRESRGILIVSAAGNIVDILTPMLGGEAMGTIRSVGNVAAAQRALLEKDYDFVIVNTPLADDPGTRFAMDAAARPGTVVLVLVRSELYEQLSARLTACGVFTLQKPTSAPTLRLALRWMSAARQQQRRLEREATSVEEKMEEIRLVNRAKWLLIQQEGLTEAQAHRRIEKQAMDRCVSRGQIARELIRQLSP